MLREPTCRHVVHDRAQSAWVVARSRVVVARSWLVFLLPVLGLTELAFHFITANRAPTPRDWKHLRSAVAGEHEPGTLVLVSPPWAEPLARAAMGEKLMSVRHLARADETRFASAIEISLLGAHRSELSGWKLIRTWDSAPFTLHRWHNPHATSPRFDFVDELQPPRVSVATQMGGARAPCPWSESARPSSGGLGGPPSLPRSRFECSSHPLVSATVTIIDDEGYRPRRCVWAHPPQGGVLEITYRGVPLGTALRGHMGIPWLPARDGLGTPVKLETVVDGGVVATQRYDEREGWRAFDVDTSAWAGGTHDVVWRVSSERFEYRHFCFEARAE